MLKAHNTRTSGPGALIVAVLGAGKIGEAVARAVAGTPKVSHVIVTKRNVSTLRRPLPRKIEVSTTASQPPKEPTW